MVSTMNVTNGTSDWLAVWREIADEFATYINYSYGKLLVYDDWFDDQPAVFLRIWQGDEESDDMVIKATVIFTSEKVLCTERDTVQAAIHTIDMRDPRAFEYILNWMKEANLVRFDVELSGKLK